MDIIVPVPNNQNKATILATALCQRGKRFWSSYCQTLPAEMDSFSLSCYFAKAAEQLQKYPNVTGSYTNTVQERLLRLVLVIEFLP